MNAIYRKGQAAAAATVREIPTRARAGSTILHASSSLRGGALVMVMIIICVLSVVAASLLLTTVSRYHTTFQSATWQESIVAAESGVDLAMNELRKRVVSGPSTSFGASWTTVTSKGATYPNYGHAFPTGGAAYPLTTAVPGVEGNTVTQVRVYVDVPGSGDAPAGNFAVAPVDASSAYISQPDNPALADPDGINRSRWWFRVRALGIAGVSGPARPNLEKLDNQLRRFSFFTDWRTGQPVASPQAARMVEVVAKPLTNFRNALMADVRIDLGNQDVLIDSYDSSKGYYSNPGNVGTMGNIATNGQLINANHATVDGDAFTNNGSVKAGDNVTGQQSSSFYQELTPVTPTMLNPAWAAVPDDGTLTTDTTYVASPSPGNPTLVRLDGINLPDGGHILSINAPPATGTSPAPSYVKVYVQGDIFTTGSSYINLDNGVNAIFYFTGNVSLQGNGIINNSFLASHLVLNGLQPPVNGNGNYPARSIDVATNQDFEGIVYAPNHDLILALTAVPPGTTGTTSVPANTAVINNLQKQITQLNNQVASLQADYAAQEAKIKGLGTDNGAQKKAAQDLSTITQDQSLLTSLNQQITNLQGALTPSQADDHARGYNGIYGGFVARTIVVASKTHVHYDETLRQAGPVNHYEIVSWFEDNASRDATGGAEAFWWPK